MLMQLAKTKQHQLVHQQHQQLAQPQQKQLVQQQHQQLAQPQQKQLAQQQRHQRRQPPRPQNRYHPYRRHPVHVPRSPLPRRLSIGQEVVPGPHFLQRWRRVDTDSALIELRQNPPKTYI